MLRRACPAYRPALPIAPPLPGSKRRKCSLWAHTVLERSTAVPGSDPGPRRSQSFRQATSQGARCGLPPLTLESPPPPQRSVDFQNSAACHSGFEGRGWPLLSPFSGSTQKDILFPAMRGCSLVHTKPSSPWAARTVDNGCGLSLSGRGQRAVEQPSVLPCPAPPSALRRSLAEPGNSLIHLGKLASGPHLPNAGITSAHHHPWPFPWFCARSSMLEHFSK